MSTQTMASTRDLILSGSSKPSDILKAMSELLHKQPHTLVPLLGLLSIRGKPYTLNRHFSMEPLYKLALPKQSLWKCGRQVGKSASLASSGILRAAGTSDINMLYCTPRYEQIRRLSTNYVRPFINNSLVKHLLVDESCTQHVLQRSFLNRSTLYFSFAFLDADRIRGLFTDINNIDETQDMDFEFLPIIQECMSASDYAITIYSGTPKTLDNTIEALWQDSTKAEWVVPCQACGYWSMASIHADLMKMIGKDGVVCGRCSKLINPAIGHWHHTDKSKTDFHGFHVPQIILPVHYSNPEKWYELLSKRDGKKNYSSSKFLNEVLGESADSGVKLITVTDIKEASDLGVNEFNGAMLDRFRERCPYRVMGVDWGGGGKDQVSFTTIALVGMTATGKIECHYCFRFHSGYAHDDEARSILKMFRESGCQFLAHDFGGSGSVRETLLIQSGLPMDRIMNFMYVRASARNMVHWHPPPEGEIRGYYALDKARSLVLQATAMKSKIIRLPEYESSRNVTSDLLALMEDKHEMPGGADVYLVRKQPKLSDDFAHALNYACICLWHTNDAYPDLSQIVGMKLSQEQLQFSNPPNAFRSDDYEPTTRDRYAD
jgi:hypothetical protein